MAISMSTVARTATDQMFSGLDQVLEKGAAAAKAKGVEESVYLNWRVAPDMHPLTRQVQIATEIPARGLSRLAGVPLPSFPDTEQSFAELRARIARARTHIEGLPSAALDANPDAEVKVPMGPREVTFTRHNFLVQYILANHYFHVTAAYLILRHLGVDIGKMDYLAAAPR